MPEVVSCPKCQRKSRVPDNLLGKKVKCPGCGEAFTAALGPAPAPPPPKKKRQDEDDGRETYEVVDGKKKRRRTDDEDEEAVSDRPRSRRAGEDEEEDKPRTSRTRRRDDDDEDDDERVTTRRRRSRSDEDDEDDDDDLDDEAPRRQAVRADWGRVRLGFTLLLTSVLILVGTFVLTFLGSCIVGMGAAAAANAGRGGPQAGPQAVGAAAGGLSGIIVIAAVATLLTWIAALIKIGGHVMCLPSPTAYGSKTLALVTLILSGADFGLNAVQLIVNIASQGMAGLAGGGSPMGGLAPAGAAAGAMILGLLRVAVMVGSLFVFGFYVRSLGLALRNYSVVGTARGWMISVAVTVGSGVLMFLVAVATIGTAFFSMANNMGGRPGAGPGAALGGGAVGAVIFGCVFLIGALVAFVWYIIMVAQTRTAIGYKVRRR